MSEVAIGPHGLGQAGGGLGWKCRDQTDVERPWASYLPPSVERRGRTRRDTQAAPPLPHEDGAEMDKEVRAVASPGAEVPMLEAQIKKPGLNSWHAATRW